MMVKVKDHRLTLTVRSHFTSFSPFNAACVYEKRTEWVPIHLKQKTGRFNIDQTG